MIDIVRVNFRSGDAPLWFEFNVMPASGLRLPDTAAPERADGLWKTTCFELFAKPDGSSGYFEFNFSPSSRWAAYAFDDYRSGMRDYPADDPEIAITPGDPFFLTVEAMPDLPAVPMRIGFNAVIEERDGTKSYWALAHPEGKPDFHHDACFALAIPATRAP